MFVCQQAAACRLVAPFLEAKVTQKTAHCIPGGGMHGRGASTRARAERRKLTVYLYMLLDRVTWSIDHVHVT